MALNLADKRVLITGSTDGLGKILAFTLAKKGAIIIVHGRTKSKVQKTIDELNAVSSHKHESVVCDFTSPLTIKKAFSQIKELDILVNNAGVWEEGSTVKTSPEKILELVNVNLASYLVVSRMILPVLAKAPFGQLVNVISVAGYEVPKDYFHTIYSATKYGLQGFSEALAKEYEGKNVRVMGYYPGGMATKLFKKAGINYKEKEEWMFDPIESVEAIEFMLTRNKKVSVKRLDLINHLFN